MKKWIILLILFPLFVCAQKVYERDLRREVKEIFADSAASVIQDSIAFPVDTTALKLLNMDEGRVAYVKDVGWFIVADSAHVEDSEKYFDHPTSGLQWALIGDAINTINIQDPQDNYEASNLIPDYSFEDGGTTPIGWNNMTGPDNNFEAWRDNTLDDKLTVWDPVNALHGGHCLKIDGGTSDVVMYWLDSCATSTLYTFSYYRKGTITGTAKIYWRLWFFDGDGASIAPVLTWNTGDINTIESTWTKVDTFKTSPANAVYYKLELTVNDADWTNATVYLDFLEFYAAASTPGWVDTDKILTLDNEENWLEIKRIETEHLVLNANKMGAFTINMASPVFDTYGYNAPFVVNDPDGSPKVWIDEHGNLWVDRDRNYITRGDGGVSAMHIGHALGWEHLSLGTTSGWMFKMNDSSGTVNKKITMQQWNTEDVTHTWTPGTSMLGSASLIDQGQRDSSAVFRASQSNIIFSVDTSVVRNQLRYTKIGLPADSTKGDIVFLNENDADADTIAIFNGTHWKYFISDN